MSMIIAEIMVEEGQSSHVVSIFEEGPLVIPPKQNAMKSRVMQAQSTKEASSKSRGNKSASTRAKKPYPD